MARPAPIASPFSGAPRSIRRSPRFWPRPMGRSSAGTLRRCRGARMPEASPRARPIYVAVAFGAYRVWVGRPLEDAGSRRVGAPGSAGAQRALRLRGPGFAFRALRRVVATLERYPCEAGGRRPAWVKSAVRAGLHGLAGVRARLAAVRGSCPKRSCPRRRGSRGLRRVARAEARPF